MKVVLAHKEGYALGGLMAVVAVGFIVMCCFDPTAINFLVAFLCCMLSAFGFYWAACTETLSESGIIFKTPFGVRQIPWVQIRRVEIAKPSGKDTAKLELFTENRKQPICIDFTKRSLQCIRLYYGEPDADWYGKAPQYY